MAKRVSSTRSQLPSEPTPPTDSASPPSDGLTTGRYLVVFGDALVQDVAGMKAALMDTAGCKNVAAAADYEENAIDVSEIDTLDAVILQDLGIAILASDGERSQALQAVASEEGGKILSVEPEGYCHVTGGLSSDYLRGFRDAAECLHDAATESTKDLEMPPTEVAAGFSDTSTLTWGLQATRVNTSRFSGQGIRVAVLDTGFDFAHPDFRGRRIVSQSFVPGQSAQDGHGHGTHCTGTSCGPKTPSGTTRRYGCAYAADIHIGKVLGNSGSGQDGWILGGMQWAIAQRCRVVSMSLGSSRPPVNAYEVVGRRALAAGCLIVAASGNESRRPGTIAPVGCPANSPSIMAIAAVDNLLRIASFSNGSGPWPGGKVDLAGPGVNVFSSVPGGRYANFSGTSMATPHVAGIAALWSQATGAAGAALYQRLIGNARPLSLPSSDVGAGLVQAPQ